MKRLTSLLAPALGCLLFSTLSASAATITSFTAAFAPNPTYAFAPSLTPSFSGSTAKVTDTFLTCANTAGCSGVVLNFGVQGTGLDPSQLIAITLDGNLSGGTGGSGTLTLAPGLPKGASVIGFVSQNFTFSAGDFNSTLLNTQVPITGNFAYNGTLSLNLANNQKLTLPSSFNLSVGSPVTTPEPGSLALLGSGLGGLLFIVRRRRTQSSR